MADRSDFDFDVISGSSTPPPPPAALWMPRPTGDAPAPVRPVEDGTPSGTED